MMYQVLAIFSGIVGLAVTAAAVYTVWYVLFFTRQIKGDNASGAIAESETAAAALTRSYLLRWTAFDYAVLLLTLIGLVFLAVDVMAVTRDGGGSMKNLPYYHYGYLLCGFVFAFVGFLFLFVRLSLILRMTRGPIAAAPDDHHKPNQAD